MKCKDCIKWEEDFNELCDRYEEDLAKAKKEIKRYYTDKTREQKGLLKSANKYIEELKELN